ncbi:MAG: tetratricopeptide repeat protein [bacterium]
MSTKSSLLCDRIGVVSLSLSVFLSIIAFIPGGFIPINPLKGYLVITTFLIGLVSWLLGRLIEGSFKIPWSPVLGSIGVCILVLLLSAFFAPSSYSAFFGESFEQGTFAVLAGMMATTFLVSVLFTSKNRILFFLKGFFGVYIVLALFQVVHLIFPQFTSLGIFVNKSDSPIGSWSDFAFLSGAVLVGFTLLIQYASLAKKTKIISIIGTALALFFVIVCNILGVWILVGFSAIVILIYTLIANRFSEERKFPFFTFGLSLVSLMFILANTLIGSIPSTILGISFVDVHPSFWATMHVAGSTLRSYPILGSGPNSFTAQWLINHPLIVNTSSFWDSSFSAGSSFLITAGIMGGALGILSIIFFSASFVYESVRKVFTPNPVKQKQIAIFCIFIISLYFMLSVAIFSPGVAIVTSAFFFLGLFLALLVGENLIPVREVHFLKDQRASFFSILAIVSLLMVSAGIAYSATEHFASLVFFQKGLTNAQNGKIDEANVDLNKALLLVDLPMFERTKVALAEQSIQKTLSISTDATSADVIKSTLQNAISMGSTVAANAINIDSHNPVNYIVLGDMLRLITPLKVEGAFQRAVDAYNKAIALAPNYPKSYLSLAKLYFDSNDNINAQKFTQKAIDLKQNYTDAVFLMAQIEVANGNTGAATQRLQDATLFDPNNPDTYFELGIIRYQSGDYTDAVTAFKSTIAINNQYLNAWYYLALADQKLGNTQEAATILTALHNRLPDNKTISNALYGAPAATTPDTTKTKSTNSLKQEKAKKLPVPDTTSKNQ